MTRDLTLIRARRAGMAAGRRAPVPKPAGRPATRSVLATLRGQLASLRGGGP
jgi:hypothetical protein